MGIKLSDEEVDFIIAALKKQAPKKPTHESTLMYKNTCPECKNVLEIATPHCPFCGQKLDWED